jgi:hypothetical protein
VDESAGATLTGESTGAKVKAVADAEHPDLALPKLRPGAVFAGYRIERQIARGGMGVVYEAVDIDLDRKVALKIIAPEHTQDPTAVARFKGEARLTASLEHPNIVPIHRGGEENGILYLAMRFVPGTNLREVIDRGPLDLPRVGRIVTQVADALDAAHRRGLVHRDVKPANILLTSEPDEEHVYLGDFGLTKRLGSVGGGLTRVGGWVGTPDYVAPEQIRGEAADGRADVYSLGCVVYEMLTGEVAYPKDSDMAKLLAHVSDPPPLPSTRRPGLGQAFDDIVERATAKDPAARYATAGDLAAALRDAIDEQQRAGRTHVAARPAGPASELRPEGQGVAAGPAGPASEPRPEGPGGSDVEPVAESGAQAAPAGAVRATAAATTHDRSGSGDGPPPGRRPGNGRRRAVIALLVLLACAVPVAVILIDNSSGGSPSPTPPAVAEQVAGRKVTAELAPVPTNRVTGVGNALLRLSGTEATISIDATGLLDAPHAMHIHAGELGRCPPASAARRHGTHRAISTVDGEPFYGPPVTALTTRGDVSPKSILAFHRFPTTGSIRYMRRINVGKAVAATIRNDNAVIVVHGIDYNRNGIYDFSALDRSDLRPSLPGETTAPALCGPLVAAPDQQSGPTKTGRVARVAKVYTASLRVQADPPPWLCVLGDPLAADRRAA